MTDAAPMQVLSNWSKTANSPCFVYPAASLPEIRQALEVARSEGLSVIAHGAGHSYTDAALNTGGVVIDLAPMNKVLSWDPQSGRMRAETGVTLAQMIRITSGDGWWPFVSPSTPEVTLGGCVAMNVNGRNSWKAGPFGAHVLSVDVLLSDGQVCTLDAECDGALFQAFVGSMGLLGVITAATVQLQRVPSGSVTSWQRSARSLSEILSLFAEEEERSDYMEAWLDGFAQGPELGRGTLSCAALSQGNGAARGLSQSRSQLGIPLGSLAARLARLAPLSAVHSVNRLYYWRARQARSAKRQRALYPYTFWSPGEFAVYHTLFPEGVETFQAFVPKLQAERILTEVLRYSHQQGCIPLWCVMKKHQADPFLLSYQLDGFSLELNYRRTQASSTKLRQVVEQMIAMVIEAGGRFYLAKDHYLTHAQYRRSLGDEALETFLQLKGAYDGEMLWQSDLFRRVLRGPAA